MEVYLDEGGKGTEVVDLGLPRMPRIPRVTSKDQREDPTISPLYRYLSEGEVPARNNERMAIERQSEDFILEKGILHHLAQENRKRYRNRKGQPLVVDNPIVLPVKYRAIALEMAHDALVGDGHFGFAKTIGNLKNRCYWKGMAEETRYYCRTCDVCQRRNVQPKKPGRFTPHPPPAAQETTEAVGMDVVGPLPKTPNRLTGRIN